MVEDSSSSTLRSMLQLHFFQLTKSSNSNSEQETRRVCDILKLIRFILAEENSSDTELINEFEAKFVTFSKSSVRLEFATNLYSVFVNQILSSLTKINDEIKEACLDIIFRTNHAETFCILYDLATSTSTSVSNLKTFHIYLMKQFLTRHQLRNVFIEQSSIHQSSMSNSLIQRITNLNEKMCNYAGTHKVFDSVNYIRTVAVDLWLCLKHFQSDSEKVNDHVSFQFVSAVFGKISFLGYSGS
jgi:hypothetical protein